MAHEPLARIVQLSIYHPYLVRFRISTSIVSF